MAKKKREEIGEQYLGHLRELGIEVDHPSADLIADLAAHWGKDKETDLGVAFMLGRIPDRAAAEALASFESSVTDKEVKREIRRALYKLAQKGIYSSKAAEDKESPREAVVKLAPSIEGYMSAVDGSGLRMLWLVKPQMGGGVIFLEGLVSDREGMLQVGGLRIRRKDLREIMEETKQKNGVFMVPVPWEYVDQTLFGGFEKAKTVERKGTEEFPSWRAVFTAGKPKDLPHPVYGFVSSDTARAGAWRSLSQRLLEQPEFQSWIVERDWIEPYLKQVEDAQESRLVLNQAQKEERIAAIVRTAVAELFAGERGQLYQRRLKDMALYFAVTRRLEEAKLALAVALALQEGDLGGLGALDITFLTGLTQKTLAYYLSQEKAKAAEEPSLIVKA